ncbi:hypothetical protein KKA14_07890 [bacterium]|nr:hypothetical protein [bacterium]
MKIYSFVKMSRSRVIDEDDAISHLGIEGKILCEIDKRNPGIYTESFDPIDINTIDSQVLNICKTCLNILKKSNIK